MADVDDFMERLVMARTGARAAADLVRALAIEAERLDEGHTGPARALAAEIKAIGIGITADATLLGRKL